MEGFVYQSRGLNDNLTHLGYVGLAIARSLNYLDRLNLGVGINLELSLGLENRLSGLNKLDNLWRGSLDRVRGRFGVSHILLVQSMTSIFLFVQKIYTMTNFFYNRAVVLFVLWNFTKRYKRLIDCFIISKFMLQNQLKIIFNYFVCVRVDRMRIKIVV